MRAVLGVRLWLSAVVAGIVSLAFAASTAATVTVGQTAPDLSSAVPCEALLGYDEVQAGVADGTASYAVPTAGVLTSWSTNSGIGGLWGCGSTARSPAISSFSPRMARGP